MGVRFTENSGDRDRLGSDTGMGSGISWEEERRREDNPKCSHEDTSLLSS